MEKLVELHFYQDGKKSMIYIEYIDVNTVEHTLRVDYELIRKRLDKLPVEIHDLAENIIKVI